MRRVDSTPPVQAIDARLYGVTANGTTDDTSALQAAITAAIRSHKIPLVLPPGKIKVSAKIDLLTSGASGGVQGVAGLRIRGAGSQNAYSDGTQPGTVLFWAGNATDPMFYGEDLCDCEFADVAIFADSSAPLFAGFELVSKAGGVTARSCTFRRVVVDGTTDAVSYGWIFPQAATVSGAADFNNDFIHFEDCRATNYLVDGVAINDTQYYNHTFVNCHFTGNSLGTARAGIAAGHTYSGGADAYVQGGSFHVYGGSAGRNQVADYVCSFGKQYVIDAANCEGSKRLLFAVGAAGDGSGVGSNASTVSLRGVRWTHAGNYADDGGGTNAYYILMRTSGQLLMEGCTIIDGNARNQVIRIETATTGVYAGVTLLSNMIFTDQTATMFVAPGGTGRMHVLAHGNRWTNSTGSNGAFPNTKASSAVAKTASYTLTSWDSGCVILAGDTGAAGITITLPNAPAHAGETFEVVRTSASFTTTIATTSAQTINGAAPGTLAAQWDRLKVIGDGSNWVKLS